MPLFKCDRCNCIDNTALGGSYWFRERTGGAFCSECYTGKWHGRFEKKTPEELGYVIERENFYGPKPVPTQEPR